MQQMVELQDAKFYGMLFQSLLKQDLVHGFYNKLILPRSLYVSNLTKVIIKICYCIQLNPCLIVLFSIHSIDLKKMKGRTIFKGLSAVIRF